MPSIKKLFFVIATASLSLSAISNAEESSVITTSETFKISISVGPTPSGAVTNGPCEECPAN